MCQDKVADRISTLNGILVAIERLKEPGVLVGDEFARLFVGPELIEMRVSKEVHVADMYIDKAEHTMYS